MMQSQRWLVVLVAVLPWACDNNKFSGNAQTDKAAKAPVATSANQKPQGTPVLNPGSDAAAKPASTSGVGTGPGQAANNQLGTQVDGQNAGTPPATSTPPPPAGPQPPVGPGANLTLTIHDHDSKLDSFQVRNSVTQQWIPLTWQAGVQTIPNACSPSSPTILSLQMHSKEGFFSPAVTYGIGTCNAPLTQDSPTAVVVGISPDCGDVKARFTLTCDGSSGLTVTN